MLFGCGADNQRAFWMPVLEARCRNVSVSTCMASRPAGSTRSSLGLGETQKQLCFSIISSCADKCSRFWVDSLTASQREIPLPQSVPRALCVQFTVSHGLHPSTQVQGSESHLYPHDRTLQLPSILCQPILGRLSLPWADWWGGDALL